MRRRLEEDLLLTKLNLAKTPRRPRKGGQKHRERPPAICVSFHCHFRIESFQWFATNLGGRASLPNYAASKLDDDATNVGGSSRPNTSSEASSSAPESSAAKMSASTCRLPRPALISVTPPSGSPLFSLAKSEAFKIARVASVSGRTSMSTRPSSCVSPFGPEARDARRRFRRRAPARDLQDDRLELQRRVHVESTQAQYADHDVAGLRPPGLVRPDALNLLAL